MNIDKLKELMKSNHTNQLIITDEKAIDYYTGIKLHTGERFIGCIVSLGKEVTLIVNQLFNVEKKNNINIHYYADQDKVMDIVATYLNSDEVGVDKNMASHFLIDLMGLTPTIKYKKAIEIDLVKAIKSSDEIVKMREASKLNDEVMEAVKNSIRIGMTEIEISNMIIAEYKLRNVEPSFEPIVAFGKNGADPHAIVGNDKLIEKQSIVIDIGCRLNGYCSDMTRTYFVNDNPYKDIYDTVLKANLKAIEIIKPGIKFSDIDGAARKVIEEAGYGQYFIHRLGHGIGMDVHEPYDVSGSNNMIVEEGMCFSIEPGIYIKDSVGVRIEDLVVVTKDRVEVLNKLSKNSEIINID